MDFIAPVHPVSSPRRKAMRRADGPFAHDVAEADEMSEAVRMDLRPPAPLANMTMLLEILSEAGTAANGASASGRRFHRRREDNRADAAVAERQYALPFGGVRH